MEYWMNRTRNGTLLAILAALVVTGCGGSEDSSDDSTGGSSGKSKTQLSLVAYSTPEVVWDSIAQDFKKTTAGEGVGVKGSYGPSGEQSRAVEAGLKADVVHLSQTPDVDRLVDANLVSKDYTKAFPHGSIVATSLVSFVVRKGNPKKIKSWDDLLGPGVKVVTANPFTSGGAKWNLLGAYAHGGLGYVSKLLKNHVPVQPKSAREALQTFTGGEGDVLISYESEYYTAVKKGEKALEIVHPADTFQIETPIALTKAAPSAAKALVEFAFSPTGQQRFAEWGHRPVDTTVLEKNGSKFPEPKKLTSVEDIGGWPKLNEDLFDPETGSIAKIEEDAGVSTAK
jgi:sulfate/thiosulfate transport system substrate-binding protein